MVRKSVEARSWLTTAEPRNIRSVMKRLVEEIASIDKQVGLLYEDGLKKSEGSGEITDQYTNQYISQYTSQYTSQYIQSV